MVSNNLPSHCHKINKKYCSICSDPLRIQLKNRFWMEKLKEYWNPFRILNFIYFIKITKRNTRSRNGTLGSWNGTLGSWNGTLLQLFALYYLWSNNYSRYAQWLKSYLWNFLIYIQITPPPKKIPHITNISNLYKVANKLSEFYRFSDFCNYL